MTTSPFRVSVVTLATLALVLALGGSVGCSRDLEVGVVLPLSGDDAPYGRSVKLGLELALAELESAGAQPVSFRVVDSRSDAKRAAVLTRQLCEGAPAIVGGVTAAESAAMLPEIAECDVLMLSVGAGNETMNELAGDALFYRLVPDAEVEAVSIARFVDESLELERLAVVAEGSAYGEGLAAALVEAFRGTVTVLRFSREDRDLSDIVTELQRISPPAVFVAAEGYGLVRAVHAVRAAGFGGWQRPILSGSALASATLLAEMGEASNGIVFAQGRFDPGAVDGVNEPLQSFVESYRARYGELPDHYAARGYDAVRVLAEAVESGGGASPMELERSCAAYRTSTALPVPSSSGREGACSGSPASTPFARDRRSTTASISRRARSDSASDFVACERRQRKSRPERLAELLSSRAGLGLEGCARVPYNTLLATG